MSDAKIQSFWEYLFIFLKYNYFLTFKVVVFISDKEVYDINKEKIKWKRLT